MTIWDQIYFAPFHIHAFVYPQVANDGIRPYFIHSSNNHQMPLFKPGCLSLGSWLVELIYLTLCHYWFTACCFLVKPKTADGSGSNTEEPFRHYLEMISLPGYYVKHHILPLMSSPVGYASPQRAVSQKNRLPLLQFGDWEEGRTYDGLFAM
jgi:hypothetical protein